MKSKERPTAPISSAESMAGEASRLPRRISSAAVLSFSKGERICSESRRAR